MKTTRSYLSNAPKIVQIGSLVVKNRLRHPPPPPPTLHQKVNTVSQSVLHHFSSFSSHFVSTRRDLSGHIVRFRLRRRLLNQQPHDQFPQSSSIIWPYLSQIFIISLHQGVILGRFSSVYHPVNISWSFSVRFPCYPTIPYHYHAPILEFCLPHYQSSSPITFTHWESGGWS
jgi:hypothetical protein